MLGLNTTTASLQLPEGEFSNLQNLRGRPFQNLAKREGIEFVSSQTGPVMGIFDFDLDGITIPLTISSGTLTFFPSTASIDGSLPEVDPFALDDPLDPGGGKLLIFAVEPTMRALQERREAPGHSTWSWPNLIFRSDGTRLNGNTGVAVADYPATDLYVPDLLYHDSFYGNPAGTRAASLINNIIDAAINTMGLSGGQDWIKTINAVSTIVYYDTSIFPTASSATPSNYRSKLAAIKSGIQKLTTINVPATQVNVESKTATTQDSGTTPCTDCSDPCTYGNYNVYTISGYGDGYFSFSLTACAASGSAQPTENPIFYGDSLATPGFSSGWVFGGDGGTGLAILNIIDTDTSTLTKVLFNIGTAACNASVCYSGTCGSVTWTMTLTVGGGAYNNVWTGTKSGGTTPAGTYNRTSGCDSRATIVLV